MKTFKATYHLTWHMPLRESWNQSLHVTETFEQALKEAQEYAAKQTENAEVELEKLERIA